jgi:bacillithiol biosynthesis cysteine-adding enzyme BshC
MKTLSHEHLPGFNPFFSKSVKSQVVISAETLKQRVLHLGPIAGSVIEKSMKGIALHEKQQIALGHLLDGRAAAMITGQQPGFMGGPLYSLFKAMTSIALAELNSTEDLPIVPIFWIEDNDHDGVEAGTAAIIDHMHGVHVFHCDEMSELQSHISISERIFSEAINPVIESITQALPNTEYGQEIVEEIRSLYQPGKNWSEAFLQYMQKRCGEFGLLFFSSAQARKQGLFKERMLHELSHPGELQTHVAETNAALLKQGMKIQAEAGIFNAFYHDEKGRHKIDQDASGALIMGNRTMSIENILDEVRENPERFSPSVLLRPLIQDSIIPTIGMIVGPGEFAYMSQLEKAYSALQISMPQLHGRHSATILISSIAKYLSKYELEPTFFMRIINEIEHDLSERFAHDTHSDAMIEELQSQIKASMSNISNHAKSIDASLEGAVSAIEHAMQKQIDGLHKKIISSIKKKQEAVFGKANEAHAWLYPKNHLQERFVGSMVFEARLGREIFKKILHAIKNASREEHLLIDVNEMKSQ